MRIKKLASLIKDSGGAYLYTKFDADGVATEQWAGNGFAVYQLQKFPILDIDSFASVLDFTAKDVEKINFHEGKTSSIPTGIEDTFPEEKPVTALPMSISFKGHDYRPMVSDRNRIHLVNVDLFAPLDGITYELYDRNCKDTGYIAVKTGMLLIATICPTPLHTNEEFVNTLRGVYGDTSNRHMLYNASKKTLFSSTEDED